MNNNIENIEFWRKVSKEAFSKAAKETMDVMGYNVVARDGWVVKINKENEIIEYIKKIGS